ncbi:MAG: hypothetical protein ACPGWS_10290 [Solirubrobacterales bacterium]
MSRYNATSQCIADAIARSISHDEIVTIDPAHSYDALVAELSNECEGSVDATHGGCNEVYEFWGQDCDGESWRVHVEVAS